MDIGRVTSQTKQVKKKVNYLFSLYVFIVGHVKGFKTQPQQIFNNDNLRWHFHLHRALSINNYHRL